MLCYVFMIIMKFMYMMYVLDFPCWALGSFLFVYMCRKIAISGGNVRGCLEIVYRWWMDSRSREFDFRGCSHVLWFYMYFFRTFYVTHFILNYVLFLRQWDPISYLIFYVSSTFPFLQVLIKLWIFFQL